MQYWRAKISGNTEADETITNLHHDEIDLDFYLLDVISTKEPVSLRVGLDHMIEHSSLAEHSSKSFGRGTLQFHAVDNWNNRKPNATHSFVETPQGLSVVHCSDQTSGLTMGISLICAPGFPGVDPKLLFIAGYQEAIVAEQTRCSCTLSS